MLKFLFFFLLIENLMGNTIRISQNLTIPLNNYLKLEFEMIKGEDTNDESEIKGKIYARIVIIINL